MGLHILIKEVYNSADFTKCGSISSISNSGLRVWSMYEITKESFVSWYMSGWGGIRFGVNRRLVRPLKLCVFRSLKLRNYITAEIISSVSRVEVDFWPCLQKHQVSNIIVKNLYKGTFLHRYLIRNPIRIFHMLRVRIIADLDCMQDFNIMMMVAIYSQY